jgi:hypothetical protein
MADSRVISIRTRTRDAWLPDTTRLNLKHSSGQLVLVEKKKNDARTTVRLPRLRSGMRCLPPELGENKPLLKHLTELPVKPSKAKQCSGMRRGVGKDAAAWHESGGKSLRGEAGARLSAAGFIPGKV